MIVRVRVDDVTEDDMADLAPLGAYYNDNVARCADLANTSATLVPDSFKVDEPNDYVEWSTQVSYNYRRSETTGSTVSSNALVVKLTRDMTLKPEHSS